MNQRDQIREELLDQERNRAFEIYRATTSRNSSSAPVN